ncbi:hypothetical protein J4470_04765 [Candidatus Woesearchaeota archaeon]|nr:hypothetical protein [Candidatus Woesearchaeota archaeon]
MFVLTKVTTGIPSLTAYEFYEGLDLLSLPVSGQLRIVVELTERKQEGLGRLINGAPVFNQHTLPVAFHVAYWAMREASSDFYWLSFAGHSLNGVLPGDYSVDEAIQAAIGHDLMEDHTLTHEEFLEAFGERVYDLALALTKPDLPYLEVRGKGRKRMETEHEHNMRMEAESTGRLMRGPKAAILIKGADRFNNALCLPVPNRPDLQASLVERTLMYTLPLLTDRTEYFTGLLMNRLLGLGVEEGRLSDAVGYRVVREQVSLLGV